MLNFTALASFFGIGKKRRLNPTRKMWFATPVGNKALPKDWQQSVIRQAVHKRLAKNQKRKAVFFLQRKLGHF